MILSMKAQIALLAIFEVANHQKQGPVSLNGIAKRLEISSSYLEQIFTKLKKSGYVGSTRGAGGGYKVTEFGMIESIQGVVDLFLHKFPMHKTNDHDSWETISAKQSLAGIDDLIYRTLSKVSIRDAIKLKVDLYQFK